MNRSNSYITALIDGEPVKVRKGQTVLEAARAAGIYIPTLCYLENLKSHGGCRLCIVDIKGAKGFPAACTTPLEAGMEIRTKTAAIQSLRRNILEMTLSEHPYTCLVCKDKKECTEFMHTTRKAGTITGCNFCTSNGDCELQDLIDYLDLKDVRYPIAYRGITPDKANPFYDLDYNLCILCGRCVRICNEVRNSNVLAFVQRGNSSIVGTAFNESQADAGCEFCGACVDVCPTGSISEKMGKWAGLPDRCTETTCTLCSVGCTMNVNSRAGRVVNVGPKPGKRTDPPQLCVRGKFLSGDITHHPSRITTPMIRRNGKWVEVDWPDAIQYTTEKLNLFRGNGFGMISSAQDTLEENYSLQKFTRKIMQSNNTDLFSSFPRDIINEIHSLFSFSKPAPDILKADTILMLGTDASISHPLIEIRIRQAFNLGKNILYANTRPTRTSQFTSREIHYKEGMEVHFLATLLAGLTKENKAKLSGISEGDRGAFVETLARSRNTCIVIDDQLIRNTGGREILEELAGIHHVLSSKSRCNFLLLGYEGNLYGSAMTGAHPDLLPGFASVADNNAIRSWSKIWGTELNGARGYTWDEMLGSIGKDGLSSLMIAGDIPIHKKLSRLKFLVQMNMFQTKISEYADVFLPVTCFLENDGHFMTLEGKVKKLRRAAAGPGKVKPITAILSDLAAAMKEPWGPSSGPGSIWKEIESGITLRPSVTKKEQSEPISHKPDLNKVQKTIRSKTHYDQYRYRGNSLSALVPDLQRMLKLVETDIVYNG